MSEIAHPGFRFEHPDCSYGSVITCDDPVWLQNNINHLVSVIYFLAEPTGDLVRPAECFEFFLFNPDAGPDDHVGLQTKAGEKIESAGSLILTPSLSLRAAIRTAPLRLGQDRYNELVLRFENDPNDRLVVACSHFFRASFHGIFQSPWEQDVAAYCACLEAAFDIPEGGYKEALLDAVAVLLGENSKLQDFISGAYAIRSVLNHGAVADEGDIRTQSMIRFRAHLPINIRTLRHICAYVIQEKLMDAAAMRRTSTERYMRRQSNHDLKQIEQRFVSEELWKELVQRFADENAARRVTRQNQNGKDEYMSFCHRFLNQHSWSMSESFPTPAKFVQVLRTMSCSFGQFAKALGERDLEMRGLSLYDAAKRKDFPLLDAWLAENASLSRSMNPESLQTAIYCAAVHFSGLLNFSNYRKDLKYYCLQDGNSPLDPN